MMRSKGHFLSLKRKDEKRVKMAESSIVSGLPFLQAPSASDVPATFLALTPMSVVFETFDNYQESNELGFYTTHEKFHLDQARHIPMLGAMVWSVVSATLDENVQRERAEALLRGSETLQRFAPILEGQNLLFFFEQASWQPGVRAKIIERALVKGSAHYEGLRLFFRDPNVTPGSFDEHVGRLKAEVKDAGLDFGTYITGFVWGLLEVAPFLDNRNFDPNIAFEGTGWLECAEQSCRVANDFLSKRLSKQVVTEIQSHLENARQKWFSAYERNIIRRVVYPYILSLMRQMHPYRDYHMQFPTFFVGDCTVREGNIPGQPIGTDKDLCHAIAWFYHAAALKILQARLGAPLRCPVYEIMNGRRATCCEGKPSKGLCSTESVDHILFEERMKHCQFFWRMALSLYRLLERGGIHSGAWPVLDILDAADDVYR